MPDPRRQLVAGEAKYPERRSRGGFQMRANSICETDGLT